MLPWSWIKNSNNGFVIPAKMGFFIDCSKEKCCDRCHSQINEKKEFLPSLILLKTQVLIEFGHMLPHYKLWDKLKNYRIDLNNFNSVKLLYFFWKEFLIAKKASSINEWY